MGDQQAKELHLKKKQFARSICDALVSGDKYGLFQILQRIEFVRLDVQEICTLQTSDGKSPIRYAITNAKGNSDMLKLMKEKNISLDVELGPEKMSTLHLAVNVQDKKILKYLLSECNIRINATDAGGESALHYAVKSRSLEICEVLLKKGVNVNKQDKCGRTALHTAIGQLISDPINKVSLLCNQGANPAIQDNEGNTTLHALLKRRFNEQMQILLILMQHNPDVSSRNKDGFTAWELYESNTDHTDAEKEEVQHMLTYSPNQRSKSVSSAALPAHNGDNHLRRLSVTNLKNKFKRRISSIYPRRLSNVHAAADSAQDHDASNDVTDDTNVDETEKFPELEERLNLARAFGLSQRNVKDEDGNSLSDRESYGSRSNSIGSSYRGGFVTEDDDLGDNSSVLSSCVDSRRNSFDSPTLQRAFSVRRDKQLSLSSNNSKVKLTSQRLSELKGRNYTNNNNNVCNDGNVESEGKQLESPEHMTKAEIVAMARQNMVIEEVRESEVIQVDMKRQDDSSEFLAEQTVEEKTQTSEKQMPEQQSLEEQTVEERKRTSEKQMSEKQMSEKQMSEEQAKKEQMKEEQTPEEQVLGGNLSDEDNSISYPSRNKASTSTLVDTSGYLAAPMAFLQRPRLDTLTGMLPPESETTSCTGDSKDESLEDEDSPFSLLKPMNETESINYLRDCLDEGYQLNEFRRQHNNESLLHVAVRKRYLQLAEYLIDHGLDINAANKRGFTSLHIAARDGALRWVQMLISNGASVERMTLDGQSVLDIAVTNDKIQIIEFLLSKDTLSAFTIESALNVLVNKRRSNAITRLFSKHIDARVQSTDLEIHLVTPLAAQRQHWKVLNFIISERKRHHCLLSLNKRDEAGFAAVHYCAMNNCLIPLKRLHKAGASITRQTKVSNNWEEDVQRMDVRRIALKNGFNDIAQYAKEEMKK